MTAFPPSPSQPRIKIDRQPKQITFCKEPLSEEVTLELVQIPAGEFMMGSPGDELDRTDAELPQHLVTVPGFWMGQYPVTQAEWRVVAGLPKVSRELDPAPSSFKGNRHPVEKVSWYDAVEFCDRLTQYTGRRYRLPSEAEWEYACRAGTTTPFHFGETIATEVANYQGNFLYGRGNKGEYRQATTPVDDFRVANAFGLCDMHGNVFEWCQDHWHDNYAEAPTDGSAWLSEKDRADRVRRGGSWNYSPMHCRSASRFHITPVIAGNAVGFRVVVAPRSQQEFRASYPVLEDMELRLPEVQHTRALGTNQSSKKAKKHKAVPVQIVVSYSFLGHLHIEAGSSIILRRAKSRARQVLQLIADTPNVTGIILKTTLDNAYFQARTPTNREKFRRELLLLKSQGFQIPQDYQFTESGDLANDEAMRLGELGFTIEHDYKLIVQDPPEYRRLARLHYGHEDYPYLWLERDLREFCLELNLQQPEPSEELIDHNEIKSNLPKPQDFL